MEASISYNIELSTKEVNKKEDMIEVDLLVHRIQTDKNEPDRMTIKYATALSAIKNPSLDRFDKTFEHLKKIITTTLRAWKGPDIDQVQKKIILQGSSKLFALLNQKNEKMKDE